MLSRLCVWVHAGVGVLLVPNTRVTSHTDTTVFVSCQLEAEASTSAARCRAPSERVRRPKCALGRWWTAVG